MVARIFSYVAMLIGAVPPQLYLSDRCQGLMLANTTDGPSCLVGHDLLQGRPEKELAFIIAKELAHLHPEHIVGRLHVTPPLAELFFAALLTVDPDFPVPSDARSPAEALRDRLRKQMTRTARKLLELVAQKYLETGASPDLDRWRVGVEHTANRVGLIICNDLEVTTQQIGRQPVVTGLPAPAELVQELVRYSVSEDYFAVRRQLGLTIDSVDAESTAFPPSPSTQTTAPPSRPIAVTVNVVLVALVGALFGLIRC